MIGIYLNSMGFGGAEILVTRFCELLRNNNLSHYVVENKDSYLATNLKTSGTNVIEPSETVPYTDFLFIPYSAMLREALGWAEPIPNARILTWIISPNELFASNFPLMGSMLRHFGYRGAHLWSTILRNNITEMKTLLRSLCQGSGILLMDGATRRVVDYIYGSRYAQAMPILAIPSPVNMLISPSLNKSAGVINVGYLGRVEDFKFSALKGFISSTLAKHAEKESVVLHIVGTGPRIQDVRIECNAAGVALIEHGFQPNDSARQILVKNCDIGASMGTASLDLAGSGLPTIIIDPSLRADFRPQESFRFVHQIEEYTLGEYRDFPKYLAGGDNFSSVIDAVRSNNEVSINGFNYVASTHNPDNILNMLLDYILGATVTVGEIRDAALRVTAMVNSFTKYYFILR